MPRQARLDFPGAYHHVMGRGIDGLHIFKKELDKKDFLFRIKNIQRRSNMQIHAWCVMDNHFHLLYQTGKTSLAEFMRSLLTGYAINYNKRHKRRGYLFQNRYKSVIVEEDEYFLPLVRYIHLNPVKARIVTLGQVEKYQWSGHWEIVKKQKEGIINCEGTLRHFGLKESAALKAYEEYLKEGVDKNEDYLMGGGLIRSLGGWSEAVKRKTGVGEMGDERILGSGLFVEEVLNVCEQCLESVFKDYEEVLERVAHVYKVKKEEIKETKTEDVREARSVFIFIAVKYLGMDVKEAGKILNIKNAAGSMALKRGMAIEKVKGVAQKLKNCRLKN